VNSGFNGLAPLDDSSLAKVTLSDIRGFDQSAEGHDDM
jgi:hypothetical protein